MPVCDMAGRECPPNSLYRNTIPNITIVGYVGDIVVNTEITMINLPECYAGCSRQENAN
jgi:hypothetical protein